MKKIVRNLALIICCSLFVNCSNNDPEEFSIEGVWEAVDIYYGKQ